MIRLEMVANLQLQVKLYLFHMPSGEERTHLVPDPPPVAVLCKINRVVKVSIQTKVLKQTTQIG